MDLPSRFRKGYFGEEDQKLCPAAAASSAPVIVAAGLVIAVAAFFLNANNVEKINNVIFEQINTAS